MASDKKSSPKENVRYRVTGKCFVNGSYHDPKGDKNYFITAPAGLEGVNLVLVPNGKPEPPADPNSTG